MMLGWSKNVWIFISRMIWVSMFSSRTFFFGIAFMATIIPVKISITKKTLPNFPSPIWRRILKLFFDNPFFSVPLVLPIFLEPAKNEGRVFSLLWVPNPKPWLDKGDFWWALPLKKASLLIPLLMLYHATAFSWSVIGLRYSSGRVCISEVAKLYRSRCLLSSSSELCL